MREKSAPAPPPDVVFTERVEVARVQGPVEAELVRGILESHGIRVSLSAPVPHSVLPLNVGHLGEVQVLVAEADEEPAVEILARHLRSGLRVIR